MLDPETLGVRRPSNAKISKVAEALSVSVVLVQNLREFTITFDGSLMGVAVAASPLGHRIGLFGTRVDGVLG